MSSSFSESENEDDFISLSDDESDNEVDSMIFEDMDEDRTFQLKDINKMLMIEEDEIMTQPKEEVIESKQRLERMTKPFLTKYEYSNLLIIRTRQLRFKKKNKTESTFFFAN